MNTVKDPVCGMDVIPGIARSWDYLYEEIVYHFCGSECRSRFQVDPKKVLSSGPGQPVPTRAAAAHDEKQLWVSSFLGPIKKWWSSLS